MSKQKYIPWLVIIGLAVIGIIAYRHGWHIPYYADDYQRMFAEPQKEIFAGFVKANFRDEFYRPLETMVLAAIQTIWGWDTFPVRIVSFCFHLSLAAFIYYVLRQLGLKQLSAGCGAIFVMLSQVAAGGVLGNDTQSQVTSGLFAAISVWYAYGYYFHASKKSAVTISLIAYFLALISKETSVGVSLSIAFILWTSLSRIRSLSLRLRRFLISIAPFLGVFFIYWLLRLNAGAIAPSISTSGYTFGLGLNVVRNIFLFTGQSILPVSSFAFMKGLYGKDAFVLASLAIVTIVFLFIVYRGLRRSSHRRVIIGLIVCTICSWFPAVFLNHVGELYLYNTVPFVAALIAFSFEAYLPERGQAISAITAAVVGIYCVASVTNAMGIDDKARSMKIAGDRAEVFLPQLFALAPAVPHGYTMFLVNPPGKEFEYSIFAIKRFRVSTYTRDIVRFVIHRPDLEIDVEDSADAYQLIKTIPGVLYTYDTLTQRIYKLP